MNKNRFIRVEGRPDLVRDRNTNALLNINISGIEQAKSIKAKKLQERQEIDQLKSDVHEIKSLLQKLLEK